MTHRVFLHCARAARLNDRALNSSANGTSATGSVNVLINNRPALRVNDSGVHHTGECCCPEWHVTGGASRVQVNTFLMARVGDSTEHCSGSGQVTTGSSNVLVGDWVVGDHQPLHWIHFVLRDRNGKVVPFATVTLMLADGRRLRARSDAQGSIRIRHINPGSVRVVMARIE
jgi:uncharacterized Zn-binding protein involved in type VI secretion